MLRAIKIVAVDCVANLRSDTGDRQWIGLRKDLIW
jgi:hypothetical protein